MKITKISHEKSDDQSERKKQLIEIDNLNR